MEDCEAEGGDEDHPISKRISTDCAKPKVAGGVGLYGKSLHSIKDDKVRLILHDAVCPSVGHLRDTVHTSDEDGQKRKRDRGGEEPEFRAADQKDGILAPAMPLTPGPVHIIPDHNREAYQGGDLPYDTGHHKIVPRGLHAVGTSRGSDASSRTLENQGEEIAGAEDPGVVFGLDAAVLATDGDDKVFQSEVDGAGDECGGDDETNDLDVEAVAIPGVVVQHDASSVAWIDLFSKRVTRICSVVCIDIPTASPTVPKPIAIMKVQVFHVKPATICHMKQMAKMARKKTLPPMVG